MNNTQRMSPTYGVKPKPARITRFNFSCIGWQKANDVLMNTFRDHDSGWALTDGASTPARSRIRDLPTGQRPREKLLQYGPAALDASELLALFISSGTQGRSAIEIGRELIARFGSIAALGAMPVAELAKVHGLGPAKASTLAAAFELGHRAAREKIRDCPLDSPERVHDYFAPQLAHLAQEQVVVALLDVRLRHLGTSVVSIGSVSESTAHPREILRPEIGRAHV
jgi:DNA repair protein RadC